ncbi:hypothetical protein CA233_16470 [Sphingomonas sp. ABOLD]|uniref:DUF4267 domain-containing protein n=1 Tax=Sphingomonas trueperi TaxID=53317 RepID=A0A7X5XWI7_9SPHN|nr:MULTISPECIES: hypothetical protein [Sphingomonas]NJB96295.1 hypothetical protein [Sphingomonas trueperi]RSV42576.1 hypothetical protein CA234_07205 [Sphingomonas sp. ABOLE]RSV43432.1 hypothetical protein CA233_16470 [Sphingomonas sp. ABOLD]
MDYRKLGFGLGVFSIGLGIAELAASKRIARGLSAEDHDGVVRAFGARELLAGAALLSGPAHSVRVWNRVAGDAMDIAALGLAARRAPQNKAVWGAIAFVAAATVIDIVTAIGLDRTTGKTLPVGQEEAESAAAAETPSVTADKPTSIEPGGAQALASMVG